MLNEDYSRLLGFRVEMRYEGKARFLSPALPSSRDFAPTSLPAFFNPASKLSRDMAVLFLKSYFENKKIAVCEPLAGTGVRSIRFIVESELVDYVLANDISSNAYQLIKLNAKLNNVEDRLEASNLDANELLAARGRGKPRFDYVDIDPAGSPARFMENGFRGCGKDSVLGATATDLSALTGSKPLSCLRKYDSYTVKTPFSKEVSMRILAGFMVRTAARIGLAAEPVLAFVKNYYTRIFVRVFPGIDRAKRLLREIGWISYCPRCLALYACRISDTPVSICRRCSSLIQSTGPLWLGRLCNDEIVGKMLNYALSESEIYSEAAALLKQLLGEDTTILGYYPVNTVSSTLKVNPVKPSRVIEELKSRGYKATSTHLDLSAFKTDAPPEIIKEAYLFLSRK